MYHWCYIHAYIIQHVTTVLAVVTQLHHMYANCKRITYYLNTCGVALCPHSLSLSFSLSDIPSLTGRHWSWDPYICVPVDITMLISCLLWCERISSIAQDWHICNTTISGFNLNFWPPFECAGGVLIDSVSLYTLHPGLCLWVFLLYFSIHLYRKHFTKDWWLFQ